MGPPKPSLCCSPGTSFLTSNARHARIIVIDADAQDYERLVLKFLGDFAQDKTSYKLLRDGDEKNLPLLKEFQRWFFSELRRSAYRSG